MKLAAADSTGLEAWHCSRYFTKRRKITGKTVKYSHFPKLSALVDIQSHMVLAMLTEQGPKNDVQSLVPLLDRCVANVCVHHLLADAGYDSESNHVYARDEHGILTTIPPKHGRPTSKPPSSYYRRLMAQRIHLRPYGQRWQVETVFSMIKRNQGAVVAARSYHARNREMRLAVLTHNIGILLAIWLFYRADSTTIVQYQTSFGAIL